MDNESYSENEYSILQLISRFRHICVKLIPPFLQFHFSRHKPHSLSLQKAVKKIKIAFQELGGTFIKLGQMLSARPDIVGPELSDELRNLLDKQVSMPFKIAKNIIETEL